MTIFEGSLSWESSENIKLLVFCLQLNTETGVGCIEIAKRHPKNWSIKGGARAITKPLGRNDHGISRHQGLGCLATYLLVIASWRLDGGVTRNWTCILLWIDDEGCLQFAASEKITLQWQRMNCNQVLQLSVGTACIEGHADNYFFNCCFG